MCAWYSGMCSLTLNISALTMVRAASAGVTFSIVARGVASSCAPSLARVPARLAPRLATHTAFHVSRLRCRRLLEMEQHAASHTARPSCHCCALAWHSAKRQLKPAWNFLSAAPSALSWHAIGASGVTSAARVSGFDMNGTVAFHAHRATASTMSALRTNDASRAACTKCSNAAYRSVSCVSVDCPEPRTSVSTACPCTCSATASQNQVLAGTSGASDIFWMGRKSPFGTTCAAARADSSASAHSPMPAAARASLAHSSTLTTSIVESVSIADRTSARAVSAGRLTSVRDTPSMSPTTRDVRSLAAAAPDGTATGAPRSCCKRA
mmetsp:Transcript_43627/g.130813  ORF Transcript_43627/g.130813 Transcript_43627/m.130813 type:complete len:324 (-) Transcript_43627:1579-2550(-)